MLTTVQSWTFTVYGFPLYMLLIRAAIFSVASFPVVSVVHRAPVLWQRGGRAAPLP